MCRWLLAACAAVVVLAHASGVRADALTDARKAVEGSDYVTAKTKLEEAITSGSNGPAELAEIYKLAGTVEGALGNAQQATIWFAKWLAIDPKASLPDGTSPKFKRPFDAASVQAKKKGPIEAKAETEDNPPAVTLVVVNDPHNMIVGAKVYFRVDKKGPEQDLEAEGKERIKIELDVGKRIDLRLHAVDEYGNRVVELGSKDVPIVITSSGTTTPIGPDPNDPNKPKPPTPPPPPEEPAAWYATWWVWGIATGVTALGTGYFAWRVRSGIGDLDTVFANSYDHEWNDAQDIEGTTRRDVLITNIGLGLTGALLVGTAIFYLTRPTSDEAPAAETAPRAAVTPLPGGGGAVVLGGHF